jgi:hypothetical protein
MPRRTSTRLLRRLVALAALAIGTATPTGAMEEVDGCGVPNCGIEMCPDDLGQWCGLVGCNGSAVCSPALSSCGWQTGIICFN